MVGILDPPRAGVADAIRILNGSGVQVKMVTGDAEDTAVAIGKDLRGWFLVLSETIIFYEFANLNSFSTGSLCNRQHFHVWRTN